MRFVDECKVYIQSGAGGDGCMSFRREANVPFGGPDGGDGGRGGHVYAEASDQLNTLVDFRYQQHIKAGRGGHGMGKQRTGASGDDAVLVVPVGTQILDEDQDFVVADLTEPGQRVLLLEGGRPGLGNMRFKSSTNQAPRRTTPGGPAAGMWVWMRLKLLADAGIVGLPNAGKSTFLARVSRAKPKIADYPFTTLTPQLGVVGAAGRSFVLADIPGLIAGAHQGHGVGDRFLGHVERCGVLLHLVDAGQDDIVAAYRTVREEVEAYGTGLPDKPEIVALNKIDLVDPERREEQIRQLEEVAGTPVFALSAATGEGVAEVVDALTAEVDRARASERARQSKEDAEQGAGGSGSSWSPV